MNSTEADIQQTEQELAEVERAIRAIEIEVGVRKAFKDPRYDKLDKQRSKLEHLRDSLQLEASVLSGGDPIPGREYKPSPELEAPPEPKRPYSKKVKQGFMQGMDEVRKILEDPNKCEAEQEWDLMWLAKEMGTSVSVLRSIYQKQQEGRRKFAPKRVKEKLEAKVEDREWLIASLISCGTTIVLFADGGVGKTLFAYDICKAIATGNDWNGFPTKQGKVLIVQTDEPEIDTCERLNIAEFGSIPDGQAYIATDWQFSQKAQLKKWIEQERPAFIMIDSLTSSNRASEDSEKDTQYGACLYDLRDMANDYGCTIMVLHHENKVGGMRGATSIKNNVSEVMKMRRPDAKENLSPQHRVIEFEKSRSGLSGSIQIFLDVDNYSWEHQGDLGAPIQEGVEPLTIRLLKYLVSNANVRFEPEELVHEFGATKDAIRKALERHRKRGLLKAEDRVKSHKQGTARYKVYYSPKDVSSSYPQNQSGHSVDAAGQLLDTAGQTSGTEKACPAAKSIPQQDLGAAGQLSSGDPHILKSESCPAVGKRVRVNMDGSKFNGQVGMVQEEIMAFGLVRYKVSFVSGGKSEYTKEQLAVLE